MFHSTLTTFYTVAILTWHDKSEKQKEWKKLKNGYLNFGVFIKYVLAGMNSAICHIIPPGTVSGDL